jgi:Kef-type K+ transport system membrane component KefB/mannitol/fructose-specific phosphotransferase system IIA component (Ntr-type)
MKFAIYILILPMILFASGGGEESSHTHQMTMLVFQLGIILFAARASGAIFKRLKFPPVLGELIAGIIIGPYLLGGIAFPGFANGLFPLIAGAAIPVSTELYGIATIASIILLFMAGLETDLKLFLKFSFAGSVVGVGGVIFSFVIGDLTAVYFIDGVNTFMAPQALFLGVMSTATSVGITVRVLSENKKLDTPEGVTILAGAVIDDILGIILLAIVVGISAIEGSSHSTDWGAIAMIGVKAISVWLGFTIAGLFFAEKIANFLKLNSSLQVVSVMSLGLALILAGIFEQAGLAMIIGAYVMGLTLSKTDLNLTIQENLEPLSSFFVPIFFAVMGMLVNVKDILSKEALIIGGIYTFGAIIAKMIGSGVPALFLNFNRVGALRIGLGMVPRGEVALIIAGVGLASGILDKSVFSIAVLMTLITTLIAPILLAKALTVGGRGTKKDVKISETGTLTYEFPSNELADMVEHKVLQGFLSEGFMLHRLEGDDNLYHIQKDQTLILFKKEGEKIEFDSSLDDQIFVKSMLYEMLVDLNSIVEKIKDLVKPEEIKKSIAGANAGAMNYSFGHLFKPECIKMKLEATTKEGIIEELLEMLHENSVITDLPAARKAVLEREAAISTGMQYGVAIPHGRISQVDSLHVAVGFAPEGIDFGALDGEPSKVFILTVVPTEKKVPYVQFLAAISSALINREKVERLCKMSFRKDVIAFFSGDHEK